MKLAARQHRLQQIARIHRAVRLAGADDGMQLVDEQNNSAVAFLYLIQNGFETLLKFAAEFRTGDERAHVQRENRPVAQILRHVAAHNADGKSFRNRSLADARLTDETRIVFRLSRQNPDGMANLLVSANHGIELLISRKLREVLSVFAQHVVSVLGIVVCHPRTAAQLLHGFFKSRTRKPRIFENFPHAVGRFVDDAENNMLDGNVLVLHFGGDCFRSRKRGFPLP